MLAALDGTGNARLVNEASELIGRYPKLERGEVDHLVAIFPRLPSLDVALMLSDGAIGPRAERFMRDHRRRLRIRMKDIFGLLSPFLLFIAVMLAAIFR